MLEIDRMLTISTAHISPSTRKHLDDPEWCADDLCGAVIYPKGEYGWFVYPVNNDLDETMPTDLQACINFAKANNCSVLCLDRDGYEVSDLPVYSDDEED